ncbi:hypothetical protein GGS21DRAFT_381193 [Xylaria nigripes]|nr:hypothetical protein GGS21DRAFT_381193 [Xylaria nigripes]
MPSPRMSKCISLSLGYRISINMRRRTPHPNYSNDSRDVNMFARWKYDPKDNDCGLSAQPLAFDPITAKTTSLKACTLCRAKKLKCNGERSGCQRCKAQGQECAYVDTVRQQRKSNVSKHREQAETRTSVSSPTSSASSHLLDTQLQQERHDDFSWLMAQPTDVFAEPDLLEDGSFQCVPWTLAGDIASTTESSDTFVGLSSSLPSKASSSYPSLISQSSPSDDEPEFEFKSYGSSSAPCQCLHGVVVVMDKLCVQHECAMEKSPSSLLILHKEAQGNISTMLDCAACTKRVEYILILAILIDKLARLCYRIVHATGDWTRPIPVMSLGAYNVDTAEEYIALVGSLLGVQLRRLQILAQSVHRVSLRFNSETLEHRLTVCGGFVARSLEALRNFGR